MKLLMYRNYHLAVCILAVCICLVPLFIQELQPRIRAISERGSLGYVLRTSVTIKVMVGICIGTTLPVMVDIVLDKFSNISFSELTNTCIVLLVIFLSGTIYLSLNDQYYMAYLFVGLYFTVMITTTAAVLYSISTGVIATRCKVHPILFLFPIIGIAMIKIFVTLTILFPEYGVFGVILSAIRLLHGIAFIAMFVFWFRSLWRHYKTQQHFGVDETKEITYMVGELFFFCCHLILSFIGKIPKNFVNANESSLIFYYIIIILFSVLMTVLPNRLLRKMSEIKESVLRLKREFVRYVSHEIRSPLNVAHAGLEILKADLETAGASLAILSLLDDIFSASNAAIDILNDMLHYEHIDSGTFKLEPAVVPLVNVLAGRLEVYKYMASKKSITFHIEDQAQASEYYMVVSTTQGSAESPEEVTSVSLAPSLYIDRFRVEQIIRNLVSNAIKFTPEGGIITLRIVRVEAGTTSTSTVRRPSQEEHNPIDQLDDDSVDKKAVGFLRFEVVDNGAGSSIPLLFLPVIIYETLNYLKGSLWRISRGCSTSSCSSIAIPSRAGVARGWGCGSARTWPPFTAEDWSGDIPYLNNTTVVVQFKNSLTYIDECISAIRLHLDVSTDRIFTRTEKVRDQLSRWSFRST